jgi:hypothetical protein
MTPKVQRGQVAAPRHVREAAGIEVAAAEGHEGVMGMGQRTLCHGRITM